MASIFQTGGTSKLPYYKTESSLCLGFAVGATTGGSPVELQFQPGEPVCFGTGANAGKLVRTVATTPIHQVVGNVWIPNSDGKVNADMQGKVTVQTRYRAVPEVTVVAGATVTFPMIPGVPLTYVAGTNGVLGEWRPTADAGAGAVPHAILLDPVANNSTKIRIGLL